MILAGDIGGTNTRLAFLEPREGRLKLVAEQTFPSREHPNLLVVLRKFLASNPLPVERACLGVAGPVRNGRCDATNLPWVVDASEVAEELGIETAGLINDLEANAHGIPTLEAKDFVALNPGASAAEGNAAIISAGTGLGEAVLYWDGTRHKPFATEGGHADFAPRTDLEIELLRYLLHQYPRVSYERLVSGPGLFNIYRFLRDTGHAEEAPWLAERMRRQEPPPVIGQAALEGSSPLCVQALDLFVSIYGAEAGNLALKVMAFGGIFIGGGIAPKILPKLREPTFLNAFTTKGRLSYLVQSIPVRVIMNDKTALFGAARFATF